MQLTKTKEKEILALYDTWMTGYLNADVATYDHYFDDSYHFIGSTNNEEFLNRKDTTEFFRVTGEQLAGMLDLRNESKTLEQFGDHIFLTHICDTWFKNGEDWSYYGRFRLSSVLHHTKDGWKFIYQHFSLPDSKSEEGQTIGFDKINAENQELREAIKRRTTELEAQKRELEIEGALGRIRAQATAMKASTELLDIVVSMRSEFIKLGHEAHYFWHMMWLPNTYEKAMTSGDGTRIGFVMTLPRHIHGNIPLLANWEKSKDATVVYAMSTEEAIDYVDKMVDLGDFQNIDPQAPSHDDIRHIGGLTFIMARTTHGEIGYSLPGKVKSPPKEDLQILERFADAFDLAHRRFLDLQKAERQAREVEIELALEKVRSRTMAMQKSEELADVATVLFQQVKALGIEQWTCGFNIWETGDSEFRFYPGGPDGELLPSCKVPLLEHPIFRQFDASRRRGDDLFVYEKEGEVQKDHYRYMHSLPGMGDMLQNMLDQGMEFPDYQIDHVANFAYGNIVFITYEAFPEMHEVFKRFAKVFEQTYTRFLDLQKAEAQAREAKIEASLERVRSRAMAIRQSHELVEVIQVIFHELGQLDFNLSECSIVAYDTNPRDLIFWSAGPIGAAQPSSTKLQYIDHPILVDLFKDFENGVQFRSGEFSGEILKTWWERVFSETDFRNAPKEFIKAWKKVKAIFYSQFAMTHGFLEFLGEEPLQEEKVEILKRFTKVIDLTYTRYDDVVKAEAQAREAQIEAALERVRSRSNAMHKSDELVEVVKMLDNQINELGIVNNGSQIITDFDNPEYGVNSWFAREGQLFLEKFHVPNIDDLTTTRFWDAIKKGTKFYTVKYSKTEKNTYFRLLFKWSDFKNIPKERQEFVLGASGWVRSVAIFKNSCLIFQRYNQIEFTEEENKIFQRFGKVFDQTYTRFLDLQKAEAQAREAQIELGLERVRARAMAMQNTNELSDLVGNLLHELTKLDFSLTFCIINIVNESDNSNTVWAANPKEGKAPESYYMKFEDYPFHHAMMREWKAQTPKFIYVMEGKEKEIYDDYLYTDTEFRRFPKDVQTANRALDKYVASFVFSKFGGLQTVGDQALSDESLDILYRFGKVFDLTYTRFNDLQKAEEQAREARIELSLERVRAKAMAMHNTDDLVNANGVVFEELNSLGIKSLRSGIGLIDSDTRQGHMYAAVPSSHGNKLLLVGEISLTNHKVLESIFNHWDKKQLYCAKLNGHELKEYYDLLLASYGDFPKPKFTKNEIQYGYFIPFEHGAFYSWTQNPFNENELRIIQKFVRVIDLTYRRYFDLQKAEAQAREAQIEAALERVRSRSMAMHSSQELKDVIRTIFDQMAQVNINAEHAGIVVDYQYKKDWNFWIAETRDVPAKVTIPYLDSIWDRQFTEAKQNGRPLFMTLLNFEEKNAFYKELLPHIEGLTQEMQDHYFKRDGLAISTALQKDVGLYIENFSGTPYTDEENSILLRFAKVFEQTYTRFLDLQKAEAQAREAQIVASLERVRAATMAMHQSKELSNVLSTLFGQYDILGINPSHAVLTLINKEKNTLTFRTTGKNGYQVYAEQEVDLNLYDSWIDTTEKWKKSNPNAVNVNEYPPAVLPDVWEVYKDVVNAIPKKARPEVKDFPEGLFITEGYCQFGYIGFAHSRKPTEEEKEIVRRFATEFGSLYQRFLDLQKAEVQAREAQIEVALEKIRSRTMAMQKGEELKEVVVLLYKELIALGVTNFASCGYVEINEETKRQETWVTNPGGDSLGLFYLPLTGDVHFDKRYNAWKKQEAVFHQTVAGIERKKHLEYAITTFNSKEAEEMVLTQFPDPTVFYCFNFSHGYLHIVGGSRLTTEEEALMARFTRVFEQTYARFLDLKKAEIQTREAQINLAVERVRAKALAMHKSEEIMEVVAKLKDEVMGLNITGVVAATIFLEADNNYIRMWDLSALERSDKGYLAITDITFKLKTIDPNLYIKRVWENNENYFVDVQNSKDLDRIIEFMYENNQLEVAQEVEEYTKSTNLQELFHASKRLNNGKLCIDLLETPPAEMEGILNKIGAAFDLAYQRFLDLEKAEAQTKESQIEAALEKVRSRSLAMQKPDELQEVVAIVAEKLKELGVIFDAGGVILCTYFPDNKDVVHWIAVPDFSSSGRYYVPYFDNPIFSEAWDSKIRGDAYFSKEFPVEVKNHFFEHTFKHSDYRDMPEDYKQHILQAESHALSAAWSKNSAILIPSLTGVVPSENDAQIMQRFAKVFEQAYIRFMDLQQAEIREKEAIKQASLDRVRGEIASMRTTKDLERITPLIWKELTTLGVPFFRCGVFIIREDEKMVHAYLSKPDGTSVAALHIPFSDTDTKLIKPTIENWRLQQVYKETWNQDQFIQQTQLFMEKGQIENPEAYDISEAPPEQLVLHLIPFKQGMVYVGNHEDLTEEQISLVESLSTAFSVAYSRYEDFKALETAKNSLELTINDLKSAQAQLIQAEKMASLGELTAGIAHEIQNPLNFVNNFSEVSEELIDEMNEELENGDIEEAKAISKDLKNNLSKINHHGKRADAIVKGMLEHSRINKGEKKTTDINALLDEFVRLSYHGLRAKDKSFNANFKLDLDPNLPKVSVVSSDIGRVILNLVNNAFYACAERSRSIADKQVTSGINIYKPEVILSSKQTEHGIQLSVKDNGGGIPEQVRDKIFQPFFTTKPTGKGTGLGLSLSYDIIKAHGGELNLKSNEGEGTIFSIKIPIQ